MNNSLHTGDILRTVMKENDIKVKHLSRAIGINEQHFYRYICENPKHRMDMSAEKLKQILRALPDKAKLEFLESFAYENTD